MKKKDKQAEIIPEKMTIYEYEEKYVKRENTKGATVMLRMLAVLIGLFFVWCLFSISKTIWDLN